MPRKGSDCTSGDECSRLELIYIDMIELVNQTATLRHPYALLPATTGVQSNKTTISLRSACLVLTRIKNVFAVFFTGFVTYLSREQTCCNVKIVMDRWYSLLCFLTWFAGPIQVGAVLLYPKKSLLCMLQKVSKSTKRLHKSLS